MYFTKTPYIVKWLIPTILWTGKNEDSVYLTFDDGPNPIVTEFVLDTLSKYDVKATFFCLGKNTAQFPEIMERIRKEGHSIGHHTYEHLDGWKTDTETYIRDVEKAAELIGGKLFRPPYGRLTPSQYAILKKKYTIALWDIMAGDFDTSISPHQCFKNITSHISKGSIIVLHDNMKAYPTLQEILPKIIEYTFQQNLVLKTLVDAPNLPD